MRRAAGKTHASASPREWGMGGGAILQNLPLRHGGGGVDLFFVVVCGLNCALY